MAVVADYFLWRREREKSNIEYLCIAPLWLKCCILYHALAYLNSKSGTLRILDRSVLNDASVENALSVGEINRMENFRNVIGNGTTINTNGVSYPTVGEVYARMRR